MVLEAPKSAGANAILSLTCALAAGIAAVPLYEHSPFDLPTMDEPPSTALWFALVAAVVSAVVVALSARRSAAHVLVFGGMAGAAAGMGWMFLHLSSALTGSASLPHTPEQLLETAIAGLFVAAATLMVSVLGCAVGIGCALFHVLPVAFFAREQERGGPDLMARTLLGCAAWLALVAGGAIRLALHHDHPWRLGVGSGAFGLTVALVLGAAGVASYFATYAPRAPSPS